ncbi:DUF397 domain-containing protein [Streptomyces sp. JH34]|uniref:DUF397 domain-containing protein n=1 Tax=Streptomyces sp. JH34 TaxID=2793633 RepID=UPI0023F9105A|nr:DUF397 domain-containing protein [Streptomyces sp. JH34]MDF6017688.1 DUF397 domain-containing protein [Streptomyces sp. JH34]
MTVRRTEPTAPELEWFKSSYSTGDGGECVEVAWRKSNYSTGNGGECVEFAAAANHVHIRDSKQASGPVLTVGSGAWAGFVGLVVG